MGLTDEEGPWLSICAVSRASLTLTVIVGAITAVLLPVPVEAADEVPAPIDGVELLDPPARICGNEKQLDGPSSRPTGRW